MANYNPLPIGFPPPGDEQPPGGAPDASKADDAVVDTENVLVDETLEDKLYHQDILEYQEEVDGEQKATVDEHVSVLLNPEEIPPNSKREYAKCLHKSFKPCQRFMGFLMRFPIKSFQRGNAVVFEYKFRSFRGILFFVTGTLLAALTFLSFVTIISTMLNFPKQPETMKVRWSVRINEKTGEINWQSLISQVEVPQLAEHVEYKTFTFSQKELRAQEMFFFRRNLAPLVMILLVMFHIVISDMNLYSRRGLIATYLNFWSDSVEIMKIDASGAASKFCKLFLLYYSIWILLFCLALAANFAPVGSGAPVSFTFLWIRCFYPQIHTVDDIYVMILRGVGGLVYIYIMVSSKAYIFFFLYICKTLTKACEVWNERLETIFTKEERMKTRKEKCASRTGFDHLFKDYVTLLDLLSGADALFTNIIESYFSTTLMSIVFEVYYLVRPILSRQEEFVGARHLDTGIVALYLFNSLIILYLVATGAAEVGETAGNGLEIIRRHGVLGHRSDEEMHLMISLYMSFTGHFGTSLTAGGYSILDKPFFVAIAGTMISYIIIIFQFQPPLGLASEDQKALVKLDDPYWRGVLLMHIENTFLYLATHEPGN